MNDIVKMTKLANTLEIIATNGSDIEFYNGKLTELIVKEINEKGGIVKSEDFLNYKVKNEKDRFVVRLDANNRIYSFPSPSSGLLIPFIMKVMKNMGLSKLNEMSETELEVFYQRLTETFKVVLVTNKSMKYLNFLMEILFN
jgi:gamma-glutamyltranspeptidase